MLRFCENTYRFIGILCVLKQDVALGIKEVFTPMRLGPVSCIVRSSLGVHVVSPCEPNNRLP
jgi:hypothetical protein